MEDSSTVQYLRQVEKQKGTKYMELLLSAAQMMAFVKMQKGTKDDAFRLFFLCMEAGLAPEELADVLSFACQEIGQDPTQFAFGERSASARC